MGCMTARHVLHVISDKQRHRIPLLDALVQSALGGADVLQVRDKKAPVLETYDFCQNLVVACRDQGVKPWVMVNDRVDLAIALDLDGVHLASKSLPASIVRHVRDNARWTGAIGCSVHSLEEALAATQSGVDYLTFGHVYASESHRAQSPRGLRDLARIVDAVDIPVLAIGGIDATNVVPVLDTGCSGVAVIGSVLNHPEPRVAAEAIRNQMERCTTPPKYSFLKFNSAFNEGR